MEELERVLRAHAKRYPRMQPTDAVKLIYQNEFGGGHLIRNEQACLDYLRREYAAVEKNASMPLYEEIGNGVVRVNLAAVKEDELEKVGMAFLRSAAAHKGDWGEFREKLAVLCEVARDGVFSFGIDVLQEYLAEYEKAGFPAVSHSPEYREAYKPAYRILLRTEMDGSDSLV